MNPIAVLELLGSSRVIWIDDHFSEQTAEQLGDLLSRELEISRQCDFAEFADLFDRIDEGDENATVDLQERLAGLDLARRKSIAQAFTEKQTELGTFPTDDLSSQQIQTVCDQLKIEVGDCWPFEGAEAKIAELCAANDEHVSYIVDLNDSYGAHENTRGLDIFRALHIHKSRGTAFLLTHGASATTESTKETQLRAELCRENAALRTTPVCVIAKERLEGDGANAIADGLRTAIKRAGLRRGIHEVLIKAGTEIAGAFEAAMNSLLTIPPEQLDEYVVGRAVAEGVSELHVVERALTATMSESIRRLFATDPQAQKSASRLRALQAVSLPNPAEPHIELEGFRKKELWEPDELVNSSYAALACGDVFEFASDEGTEDARRFILLVQPCDVMIRPKGVRDSESGFLVPLKVKQDTGNDSLKHPSLPFLLETKEWVCDFRAATAVRLDTLDLATLRADGKVRYDKGQTLPTAILPGQTIIGKKLLKRMDEALSYRASLKKPDKNLFDGRCTLTLASSGIFREIAQPLFVDSALKGAIVPMLAKRAKGRNDGNGSNAANYGVAETAPPDTAKKPQPVRVATAASAADDPASEVIYVEISAQRQAAVPAAEPVRADAVAPAIDADKPSEPAMHFSWRIRRCGRVRMPFAASMLNSYLSVMGREAFDLDYLKASAQACQVVCAVETEPELKAVAEN